MGVDDYVDGEVGTAVAATAVLFSARARGLLRRAAVYGVAGGIKAVDIVTGAGRGLVRGVSEGASGSADRASEGVFTSSPGAPATPVILPSEVESSQTASRPRRAGSRGGRGAPTTARRTRDT